MKLTCLTVFPFFFAAALLVRADVIVDNLNQPTLDYSGPIGGDSNSNDFLVGQEFTLPAGPNPFQLNKITLLLEATGGGANITASLWSVDSYNNPSNEIATLASQFVASAGAVNFFPATNITLSPGIYYVVASPTTPADSGFVGWAYATTTNWTGSGMLDSIADTYPGFWENASLTNLPQQMSVQATPVPATIAINQQAGLTRLSWPSILNGYVVDSVTNLASPAWQPVTNAPTALAGTNFLSNSSSQSARFFRLRQSLAADNLGQPAADWDGPIGTDDNTNDALLAQEFTLPAGYFSLNKITLRLLPGRGAGSVTVSLWSLGTDGNPGAEIGAVASQLVSSPGNFDFVPSTPIILPTGTYYVEVAPATPADNAKVGWYWTSSLSWTGFGMLGGFANTAQGSWENQPISGGPYQMSIQVSPVSP